MSQQSYRERRLARAAQLDLWADKREEKAETAFERATELGQMIPFGQPILIGHHSERGHRAHIARIDSAMRQSVENSGKASDMASRADEIRRQAAHSIYSDDPDARERLEQKIATLERQRTVMKTANAQYRKDHALELKAMTAYQKDRALPYPSFTITNLGATIRNAQKRLASLDRPPVDRIIISRYASSCADCGAEILKGQTIRYNRQHGARCKDCQHA